MDLELRRCVSNYANSFNLCAIEALTNFCNRTSRIAKDSKIAVFISGLPIENNLNFTRLKLAGVPNLLSINGRKIGLIFQCSVLALVCEPDR